MTKQEQLDKLRDVVAHCRNCRHLVLTRTQTVFGIGNPDAEFMFVGEAPGRDEDRRGEPFVGRAGKFLTEVIRLMGFARDDVYIANVLKCRPDAAEGNRKPTPEEMEVCLPYLMAQIGVVQPKVIVALGATAMEGLFGEPCAITRVRGHVHHLDKLPVVPTFHPSFVIRKPTEENREYIWRDVCRAMELADYDTSARAHWLPEVF
jgi:uracil-DNA glycosylase family 4